MRKEIAQIMAAGDELADALDQLEFASPVAVTYNALRYAREGYRVYLEKFATGNARIVLMGMNPGPWGMAQTGVPFGEVAAVKDWMKLYAIIDRPEVEHPKRPVAGFECKRSEVSGRRLWGLFAERFKTAQVFFADHFVVNWDAAHYFWAIGISTVVMVVASWIPARRAARIEPAEIIREAT